MKGSRALLVIGACWQVVRFVLIGLIAVAYANPGFTAGKSILILWPATAELMLAACILFLAVDPQRYSAFRSLAILGKSLDIVPSVALLVLQLIGIFSHSATALFAFVTTSVPFLQRLSGGNANAQVAFLYLVALVLIIDLLVLLVIVAGAGEADRAGETVSAQSRGKLPDDDRPDLVETDLSE